ncbi:LysR family transcriptional regulator [Sneathiella glossodoripedis]|uniref:LysR family transcriptional regulator n=1 Tax=Sneathiella glossodoripedis TaxID=418853 RepID=UPI000471826A|nr:LysR family transcriptional regulator [Sneathiella glossodoripedis]
MNLDTSTLELFIRIASIGAIGKAGREFGLSPTAATQRIQTLEDSLGAKLFNRTTRSVALTSDGEAFLQHARRIVQNIDDARTDLSGGTKVIKGELRVAAPASFGRRHIAPYVTEFLQAHPQVHVRLDFSDTVVDIVEQGFDLALRIGELAPSSLIARKLADIPRVLAASPDYLKTAPRLETPQDLTHHQCLVLTGQRIWHMRDAAGETHEVKVGGNLSTNFGDVITEVALAGGGVSLRSLWDVSPLIKEGKLIALLDEYTILPEWNLWAVRPPGQIVPARVRAFIDFLEQKFRHLKAEPIKT